MIDITNIKNYIYYLEEILEQTRKNHGLKVKLKTEVNAEKLKKGRYDVIITASGSKQFIPDIAGIEKNNVVTAIDLLLNPEICTDSKKIIITGAGTVGCETAYFLAHELKKEVTIIERLPEIMKGVCTANRGFLIHHLEKLGVSILNCTSLQEIKERSVIVEKNKSDKIPDPFNTWTPLLPDNIENPFASSISKKTYHVEIDTDLIVIAAGSREDDSLYYECLKENAALEIINIGDSFSPGKVFEAVTAGYITGIKI